MNIYEINDKFPDLCNWKYKDETVKEVLLKDSGYVRDLILLNDKFALSDNAFVEAAQLTKGFVDKRDKQTLANTSMSKKVAYDYDFNDEDLRILNTKKQTKE